MNDKKCYFNGCNAIYNGKFNSNPEFGVIRTGWSWSPEDPETPGTPTHDHALINPIHTSPMLQHVDVRMYFPKELDPELLLDYISSALQDAHDLAMAQMVSAYQLKNNGFGSLLPDNAPLA